MCATTSTIAHASTLHKGILSSQGDESALYTLKWHWPLCLNHSCNTFITFICPDPRELARTCAFPEKKKTKKNERSSHWSELVCANVDFFFFFFCLLSSSRSNAANASSATFRLVINERGSHEARGMSVQEVWFANAHPTQPVMMGTWVCTSVRDSHPPPPPPSQTLWAPKHWLGWTHISLGNFFGWAHRVDVYRGQTQ